MEHTPEPWNVIEFYMSGERIGVEPKEGDMIGFFHDKSERTKANARRITACVNWCVGNSTEGMERAVEIGRPYAVERDNAIERELDLTQQSDRLLAYNKTRTDALAASVKHADLLLKQRDELLAALEYIRGLAACEEARDFPTIHNTAHEAIASVKGGAA